MVRRSSENELFSEREQVTARLNPSLATIAIWLARAAEYNASDGRGYRLLGKGDNMTEQFQAVMEESRWPRSLRSVPWQIWVVVAILAVEGIFGNLPLIPQVPKAALWFFAKCLFIVGLIKGWRWVFVLFLFEGAIHVVGFSTQAPFIAFLNFVLMLLAASALRFYSPKTEVNANEPRRRWWRHCYWILPVILFVGICVSWFMAELDRARAQQVAVEAIEKAGPKVKIEYYTNPPVPFLREFIGKDACEVFAVDASSVRRFTDEHARYLAKLPKLQAVSLADTKITDAALKQLGGLADLDYLMIDYTRVTDAGLEYLRGLKQLQHLDLKGTQVTEDGIRKLQNALPKCEIRK
jgi:hypothetical protein